MPDPASITAHVRALAKPQTAQRAAEALRILSAEEADLGSVVDAGAIPALISVLRDGSDDAKSVAAAALWNISVSAATKS
ncbi:ubiquitin-protein transferase [Aureococcus anophagefferens]|nr:ubiquitin-protein transferase [Aureococcus anophagefferens]